MKALYRGTIAYDDDPWRVRRDAGTGKRNDPEYNRAKAARFRERHRERLRVLSREYMRKWRAMRD